MPKCFFCGAEIDSEKPGRQESCPNCDKYLHCCLQCIFYDETKNNSCREPQAERVVDKENYNFCGYFVMGRDPKKEVEAKDDAKNKLDGLFK